MRSQDKLTAGPLLSAGAPQMSGQTSHAPIFGEPRTGPPGPSPDTWPSGGCRYADATVGLAVARGPIDARWQREQESVNLAIDRRTSEGQL